MKGSSRRDLSGNASGHRRSTCKSRGNNLNTHPLQSHVRAILLHTCLLCGGKINNYTYAAMRPRPEVGHSQSIKPKFGVQRERERTRERENDPAMLGYKMLAVARRVSERDHVRRARCSHDPCRRDRRGLPRGQQHGQSLAVVPPRALRLPSSPAPLKTSPMIGKRRKRPALASPAPQLASWLSLHSEVSPTTLTPLFWRSNHCSSSPSAPWRSESAP